jgi:uncharacterized protein
MIDAIGHALSVAAGMTWVILWPLILGFALSGVVQAVVSKREMTRLLPDDSPRSLAVACGLGAASSSCSYAAVALARAPFRRGADFTSAMAFEFASTNLVVELGILLAVLIGWQFTAAEFVGGLFMVAILALVFRRALTPALVQEARVKADRGISGRMEGHAEMDMSLSEGSVVSRVLSDRGFTATSHFFVMDWASIWIDIAIGLLIAGALAAWVPESFWQAFFFVDHPLVAKIWGPLVGPLVAMLSFVCSIGNVPLAAVLWNGGISFGGAISFIFADLIVVPIMRIYGKYYGRRVSLFLFVTFYVTMAAAGFAVEILFGALGLIPIRTRCEGGGGVDHLELHDCPEPGVPGARHRARGSFPADRRAVDAPSDEPSVRPRTSPGRADRLHVPDAPGDPSERARPVSAVRDGPRGDVAPRVSAVAPSRLRQRSRRA